MRIVTSAYEAAAKEREALEEMVQSDGWAVFQHHLAQEWEGPGFVQRLGMAFAKPDPVEAKILYEASSYVRRMVSWPETRIDQLKGVREA